MAGIKNKGRTPVLTLYLKRRGRGVFGANTIVIWAMMVIFGANTVVCGANIVVFRAKYYGIWSNIQRGEQERGV